MKKKSEGKTRKCLTLLGGRTSLLLCLSLMFQSSYAAEDSTVPEMGNMEIHQIAQQSSTIKGVVKDQKGEPLIGVSIVVKGTTNGTARTLTEISPWMCRITAHWYFPSSASNPKKFVIPGKKH